MPDHQDRADVIPTMRTVRTPFALPSQEIIGTSLSIEAQEILARVQRGPIRQVGNPGGNVIGRAPSSKTERVVQFESMLEFAYIVCLEWEPAVVGFWDQPLQIPIVPSGKHSRWHTTHTPDFLVLRKDQSLLLVEVKPQAKVQQNAPLQERVVQAKAWAEARGLQYWILTEEDLPPRTVLDNLVFLSNYRFAPIALPLFEEPIRQAITKEPGLTVHALTERIGAMEVRLALPCIWHLVFRHRLQADLTLEPLRPGVEHRLAVFPPERE